MAGLAILWFITVLLLTVHEWGHVAAMERLGIPVTHVEVGQVTVLKLRVGGVPHSFGLVPLFAATHSEVLDEESVRSRAIVAAAGPLVSMAAGIALLLPGLALVNGLAVVAGGSSILLGLLNLIPLPPMDGYVLLEHFLSKRGIDVAPKTFKMLQGAGALVIALVMLAMCEPGFR